MIGKNAKPVRVVIPAGNAFAFPPIREFRVVLRAGTATVRGIVQDDRSQPVPGVSITLVSSRADRPDLLKSATTDPSGRFVVTDVAPGEYRAFCLDGADVNTYLDPNLFKQFEALGTIVRLNESAEADVTLRVIPIK
jgi:hypothetical protein